ncbi:MAG: S41 family peptidase [Candidatus Gracilibacteria bacterium]|nr:S41 family peptidase [Candidatus Gracilibacteria bacterium]
MNTKNNRVIFLSAILIFLTGVLTGFGTLFIIPQYRAKIEDVKKVDIKTQIAENKEKLNLSEFWKIYSIVKNNYYDADKITDLQSQEGIIRGFIKGLGDPHSEYFNTQENKEFDKYVNSGFEGIGAYIEENPLGIRISKVMKGSPAEKAGIITGDILVKSGDIELAGLEINEARNHIKGKSGSKAIFTIYRQGEEDFITKEVIRGLVTVPSVFSEKIDSLGYIGINKFADHTSEEFEKQLTKLEKEKIDGLIIDLRLNGGGYLFSAVQIASNFIKGDETIVTTKYKKFWQNEVYTSINGGIIFDKPVVILIDRNSASASEILALAMKDYKKAILVGEKSYGKGSVQAPIPLDNGDMLKLTIAKWFSPKDKNIDGEGIEPDIEIKFKKEDYKNLYDRQFEQAKEILNKYIENKNLEKTINHFNNLNNNQEKNGEDTNR